MGPRDGESLMALTLCTGCKKELSTAAATCPHCGHPVRDATRRASRLDARALLIAVAILALLGWGFDQLFPNARPRSPPQIEAALDEPARAAKAAEAKRQEELRCRGDLQCWGDKNSAKGTSACRPHVERLAKFSFEWTDGWLDTKFPWFRWKNLEKGHITLVGDSIKFQNAFGAWQFHTYHCDYDPLNDQVLDVRAIPGRLPVSTK